MGVDIRKNGYHEQLKRWALSGKDSRTKNRKSATMSKLIQFDMSYVILWEKVTKIVGFSPNNEGPTEQVYFITRLKLETNIEVGIWNGSAFLPYSMHL